MIEDSIVLTPIFDLFVAFPKVLIVFYSLCFDKKVNYQISIVPFVSKCSSEQDMLQFFLSAKRRGGEICLHLNGNSGDHIWFMSGCLNSFL